MPFEDETLERVVRMIGPLGSKQSATVLDAISANAAGVLRLAERIATDEKVDNPPAVFMTSLSRGDHEHEAGGVERLKPREAFRGFFDERREWLLDQTDLDANAATEAAIDYAVSSFSVRSPIIAGYSVKILPHDRAESVLTLEDELRRELGRPRPVTLDARARETLMRDWRRVVESLHDKRIAAMHRALMEQCAIPGEPTHAEADVARQALLAEIEALGVEPRSLVTVEPVEGFTAVGEETSS